MSFMVMTCGGDNCDRLLYVEVKVGEATVLCYKCGSGNLITFKPDDTDSED